jgi:hypothetical protein
MGLKFYFWMLLLVFLSLGILIQWDRANAKVAAEVEPGVIELSTTTEAGFEVGDVFEKITSKNKTNWVYFCISEKSSKKSSPKCFYGARQDFKTIKKGLVLNGIQFGLKNRIQNSKGNIPLEKNAYFYPALILRPQI